VATGLSRDNVGMSRDSDGMSRDNGAESLFVTRAGMNIH
jgi:hypothetical protein